MRHESCFVFAFIVLRTTQEINFQNIMLHWIRKVVSTSHNQLAKWLYDKKMISDHLAL